MDNLKELTFKVCEIAKQIGSFLREERKSFSIDRVEEKQDHDYVSYVDKTAERMIVEKLKKLQVKAGFITEEETIRQSDLELNWVVDPLDGTTNYIQDYAPYCVSIALRNKEDLLIGVVYEVSLDECFYAWKGGGVYLNNSPIKVTEKKINQAFIGLELPYNAMEYKATFLNLISNLYGVVSGIRTNGSAAMGLCYVAVGRFDGWMEAFIKPWDYSAGALIVREAGGLVTDYEGNQNIHNTHHIIATNGIIHNELIKAL